MSGRVGMAGMVNVCNRQEVSGTSGDACHPLLLCASSFRMQNVARDTPDVDQANVSSNNMARPRILVILGISFIALLYLLYAAASIQVLINQSTEPEVLSGVHQLPQMDFGLFWCAGKELTEQLAHRFGFGFSDSFRQVCQTNILAPSSPISEAWPYPPTMGLLVVPFSFLPLKLGFWIWRGFCLCFAVFFLREARLPWRVVALGLAAPAAWHDFTGGQNGTLTGALLVSVLFLAARHQGKAGILAGLLTLKPHIGLPVLLASVRLRAWHMISYASGLAMSLVIIATILWGRHGWVWFFGVGQRDEWLTQIRPIQLAFPAGAITTYHMARSFGFSNETSWCIQFGGAFVALISIWLLWKPDRMAPSPRVICTVCLGILIVPHGYFYDLVGYSICMAILMTSLSSWAAFVAALFWLFGGYTLTMANQTGLLIFPLFAVAATLLTWHFRHEPALQ